MERRSILRSISRSRSMFLHRSNNFRSSSSPTSFISHRSFPIHRFFSLLPRSSPAANCGLPSVVGCSDRRFFCSDTSTMPVITDPDVKAAFKDLMAASWDELPDTLLFDVKEALSKDTDDKAGQEALANVFRAAEAVEKFSGTLVSLRMELDDSIGLSGEQVGYMADDLVNALRAAHDRYIAYLNAFGPDETYLRKKVEMELGTKMIHLKMRCSGLAAEWGKVTVLGTSGLSGSYIEHRAP